MQGRAPLAFITGASSGIGQALAQAYAKAGWRLALVTRTPERLRADLARAGQTMDTARVYAADVAVPDRIIETGDRCLIEMGVPDVVIASAGISVGFDTAERQDLEVMAQTLSTNLIGMAATFQPFVGPMRSRGSGRLVGIASVAAMRGLPGHGAYCASKAGVMAYCESLRVELRRSGVRVVTLVPGFIDTPMTRGNPYPMPFLISAEAFAQRALRAIERGQRRRVIPWQMGWTAAAMRWLPDALWDCLIEGRGRKPRRPPGPA